MQTTAYNQKLCWNNQNVPNVHQITVSNFNLFFFPSKKQTFWFLVDNDIMSTTKFLFIAFIRPIHFQCITVILMTIEQMFTGVGLFQWNKTHLYVFSNSNCTNKMKRELKMIIFIYVMYVWTSIAIKKMPNWHFIAPHQRSTNMGSIQTISKVNFSFGVQ